MCTPCLRYHSIDCSNGPFGGGIRFPSFQNENEPQCPPCGRQVAARLSSVPAVLLRSARGEKKILTQSDAPLPGGVANTAQRRMLQWGKRQKGLSSAALPPCRLFSCFAYLHVHLESPPPAPWIGLGGWMWHVAIRSFLNGMSSYSVQKFLPLCVRRGLLYERDGGLCAATNWLVQQVCTRSTGTGGL